MYGTYLLLKKIAEGWDEALDDEGVREECWKAVPDLLRSLEIDLFEIFAAKVIETSVGVYVGNPFVRQSSTQISVNFITQEGNRTWLTIDCLPDVGRIILIPFSEPDIPILIEGYQRIRQSANTSWAVEMSTINLFAMD
jgi:hypothetical protein